MKLFIGLDGDSIGREIERNIIHGNLSELKLFSEKINLAIDKIKNLVEVKKGEIVMHGGDSIFFYGEFDEKFAQYLIEFFYVETNRTASVGVGRSPYEAYLGLKLAKSYGGNRYVHFKNVNDE